MVYIYIYIYNLLLFFLLHLCFLPIHSPAINIIISFSSISMGGRLNSSANSTQTMKFLYSYGGKITPRPNDGQLRYVGGYTRVLSVDRSITFSELMVKFAESCGSSVILKCKLPSEDLDLLVSIKSDEELKIVIKEYDRASPESKIRAVLFPIKSVDKLISQPLSPVSCLNFPSAAPSRSKPRRIPAAACYYAAPPCVVAGNCHGRRSVRQCCYVPFRDYSCCCQWH